jgi:hypothetical protein
MERQHHSGAVRAWVETEQRSSGEIGGEERRGQQRRDLCFFLLETDGEEVREESRTKRGALKTEVH